MCWVDHGYMLCQWCYVLCQFWLYMLCQLFYVLYQLWLYVVSAVLSVCQLWSNYVSCVTSCVNCGYMLCQLCYVCRLWLHCQLCFMSCQLWLYVVSVVLHVSCVTCYVYCYYMFYQLCHVSVKLYFKSMYYVYVTRRQ